MDDREAPPPSSRRRALGTDTMPEVPIAKKASTRPPPAQPLAFDVGDSALDFVLPNEAGVALPLSALRGGPVLLCFAPAWAQPALADALAAARRTLGQRGGAAALVVDGDVAEAAAVAEPHGRDLLVLADERGEVHRAYGVLGPSGGPRVALFLLDARGDVARTWADVPPEAAVSLALSALDLAR